MLLDGLATEVVPADDRGLLYGDGLFETIRFDAGRSALWDRHLARLAHGCEALGLALPASRTLAREAAAVLADERSGVVRITLTRGSGPRGYGPPVGTPTRRLLSGHPLPPAGRGGLRTMTCRTPLASGGQLGGIKHIGRLEQVLGAREVAAADCDEGLMLDASGQVVCGTSSNVVLSLGGQWITPVIDDCGVRGVFRGWLLDRGRVAEDRVHSETLAAIDAGLMVNSVRGFRPLESLDGRSLDRARAEAFAARSGTPW